MTALMPWNEKRIATVIMDVYRQTGDRTKAVRAVLDGGADWEAINRVLFKLERKHVIPERRVTPIARKDEETSYPV